MRNFARINNYYNNMEARRDWLRWTNLIGCVFPDMPEMFAPPSGSSWRKIDKAIDAMRNEFVRRLAAKVEL
jgi:hypothetical protein